jgi:glyoxylase-like metal-dependent hydrolase (beta-lactamase superfamily II)/rhodanese-related sulfurtransferase
MYFKQFYLGCLAHASYLIGDEETGEAAVIDPQRDIADYLEEAQARKLGIKHVLLTHFHADFVSGHLEFRDTVGAQIYLGARAEAEYDFTPLHDGDEIAFGKVKLKILETPGHTPESICILVYDLAGRLDKPHAVLTGDTLFIGDVGRPDLMASMGITEAELAGMLYDSIHEKLLRLPDETLVYPAHGAGSMCGKNLSKETFSTLGDQRRYNYALKPMSKAEFIEVVTADQPEAPKYFSYDAMLNRQERSTLRDTLAKVLKPLSLDAVLRLRDEKAQILDVRDPSEFASAHMVGSINIGLKGQYAHWCGSLLDRTRPIVIIADPGREEEAALRLGRIGFDHIAGYLDSGMLALRDRPDLVRRCERVTAEELAERLSSPEPPVVLDVRSEREYQTKHIAGSLNVPLHRLVERLQEVPRNNNMVIHCAGGYRSSIAASLLRLHDIVDAPDLIGGIAAWEAAKQEIVPSAARV